MSEKRLLRIRVDFYEYPEEIEQDIVHFGTLIKGWLLQ